MKVLDVGLTKYGECYRLQKEVLNNIKHNGSEEHIIITEHYPVITVGRTGSRRNILVSEEFLRDRKIGIIEVDRGGDVTYHGPGQIVLYPIIDLKRHQMDLHKYLRSLEEILITSLMEYGIEAYAVKGRTGVWTPNGKIASIGIGASNWITYHGIALNVDCDLTPFKWINPCGFKDIRVTSVRDISCREINKSRIKESLTELFCEKYEYASAMA